MEGEDLYAKLRRECWEKSFYSFGYGFIFNKRAQRFGMWITLLKVFGLLVPATIGSIAIAYGLNNSILSILIAFAIPITIIQFVFSLLAVIYKWDDELTYAYEASQAYSSLSERFKKLANFPPTEYAVLDRDTDLIKTEYTQRNQQDSKHNIKEWEERKGMRFALRQFKWECVGCKKTPISMDSTECPVCGYFSLKHKLLKIFK